MKGYPSGMVLLTTMIMLSILTLLVLSLMQGVFLYVKSTRQIVQNHALFYQLEKVARTLDLSRLSCVVSGQDPNQLMYLVSRHQGCGTKQYHYNVQDMGLFPCLQIFTEDKVQGSHHWLVTIANTQQPDLVLQLRFAVAASAGVCETGGHLIQPGVVSWRKIHVLLDSNNEHDKIFD